MIDESDSDISGDDSDIHLDSLEPEEELVVQSAIARIQRAKDKGRVDVRLSKLEIAVLDKRRKILKAEGRKGPYRKNDSRREIAVPLSSSIISSQLEPIGKSKRYSKSSFPSYNYISTGRPSIRDERQSCLYGTENLSSETNCKDRIYENTFNPVEKIQHQFASQTPIFSPPHQFGGPTPTIPLETSYRPIHRIPLDSQTDSLVDHLKWRSGRKYDQTDELGL